MCDPGRIGKGKKLRGGVGVHVLLSKDVPPKERKKEKKRKWSEK